MYTASKEDIRSLINDKYGGDSTFDMTKDIERLSKGEPLAYVIGWVPFLGLKIFLSKDDSSQNTESRKMSLIPRPETEWWAEKLNIHLERKYTHAPFTILDLCSGSGAIGLSVLKKFPYAQVTFSDIEPTYSDLIKKNIVENKLDVERATILTSNLYDSFPEDARYDIIVSNPPYIPTTRKLDASVTDYEPSEALWGGIDGLSLIGKIIINSRKRLSPQGELWIECDVNHSKKVLDLCMEHGAKDAKIEIDLYGRERLLMAYYK
jgi:release factor glutamine methyltransferase